MSVSEPDPVPVEPELPPPMPVAEEAPLAPQAEGVVEDEERANLRTQLRSDAARLRQIRDASPPFTQAQRDSAIQELAAFLLKLGKALTGQDT